MRLFEPLFFLFLKNCPKYVKLLLFNTKNLYGKTLKSQMIP